MKPLLIYQRDELNVSKETKLLDGKPIIHPVIVQSNLAR